MGGSLNNRYACFATAFLAGLIGVIAVARLFRQAAGSGTGRATGLDAPSPFRHLPLRAVPVLSGLLAGLLVANWLYGVNMMEAWRRARMRAAVDLHFSPFLGLAQDRGGPPMNLRLAVPRAQTMDRLGFLHPPLAKSLRLSDLTVREVASQIWVEN